MDRPQTITGYSGYINSRDFDSLVEALEKPMDERSWQAGTARPGLDASTGGTGTLRLGARSSAFHDNSGNASPVHERRKVAVEPANEEHASGRKSPRSGSGSKAAAILGTGSSTTSPGNLKSRLKEVVAPLRRSSGEGKTDELPLNVRVASFWQSQNMAPTGQQKRVEEELVAACASGSDEAATDLGRWICMRLTGGFFKICAVASSDQTGQRALLWATAAPIDPGAIKWTAKELCKLDAAAVAKHLKKARYQSGEGVIINLFGHPHHVVASQSERFFSYLYGSSPSKEVSISRYVHDPRLLSFSYDGAEKPQPKGDGSLLLAYDPQHHLLCSWGAIKNQGNFVLSGAGKIYFQKLSDRVEKLLQEVAQTSPRGSASAGWLPHTEGQAIAIDKRVVEQAMKLHACCEEGLVTQKAWPVLFAAMAQCIDLIKQGEKLKDVSTAPDLLIRAGRFQTVSKRLPRDYSCKQPPTLVEFVEQGVAIFDRVLEKPAGVVVIEQEHHLYYLPFEEGKELIAKVAPGYNLDNLVLGDLLRLTIDEDGTLKTQLRRAVAEKLLQHHITVGGQSIVACNEQWTQQRVEVKGWPKIIDLAYEEGVPTATGYVQMERVGMPPLYVTTVAAQKIVKSLSGQDPGAFSSADIALSCDGGNTKVTATTANGCAILFRRSLEPNQIKPGSWIACGEDGGEIEEHIIRVPTKKLPPRPNRKR